MSRRNDHDETAFLEHLDYLGMPFIREHYIEFIREAAAAGADHLAPLMRLVEGEAALRKNRSVERRIRLARFPVRETLDQFDWSWPRKINRLQLQNLFRLLFLDDAANVVLIGGLGKSHPAIALGYTACQRGYSALFASAIDVVNTLMAAQAGGRLKSELNRYVRPRLLLIDELGYLPIDKAGADLLFQIISQQYERGSTVITPNRVYKKWPEIFNNDSTLTSAVLDRLLHHAETVTILGQSYRMKDEIEP